MNIHNFRELKIWQKSRFLAKDLHPIILTFPKYEIYGMMSQMQRASVSLACNIAEGSGRVSTKEFQHYLTITNGSLFELETLLELAQDFKYINNEQYIEFIERITELKKMIFVFYNSLNKN